MPPQGLQGPHLQGAQRSFAFAHDRRYLPVIAVEVVLEDDELALVLRQLLQRLAGSFCFEADVFPLVLGGPKLSLDWRGVTGLALPVFAGGIVSGSGWTVCLLKGSCLFLSTPIMFPETCCECAVLSHSIRQIKDALRFEDG